MYKEEKKLNPSVIIDWLNKGKVDAKALFTYFDKEGKEIPYEERENAYTTHISLSFDISLIGYEKIK